MTAARYILGFDLGTTSAKMVLVDQGGKIRCTSQTGYEISFPAPGCAEQDAAVYWQAMVHCTAEILKRSGVAPDEIGAIGLSGMAPNCILVDRQLRPLKAGLIWMDARALEECKGLRTKIGEDAVWKVSANPIHPYYGLPKFLWERNHHPDLYGQTYKVLSAKDYILAQLTGEAITDYSTAALQGIAFNIRDKQWDPGLLDLIGIDSAKLPAAFPCDQIVGKVTATAAAATGLAAGTPVVAGTVDTGADAAACGITEPGHVFLTMGTAICIGAVLDAPSFVRELMAFPHPVHSASRYITTGAITSGGALLKWFGDVLSWEHNDHSSAELYARLDAEAASVPAGSEGLLVFPGFMGERAPYWNPLARGVFFGLSLRHTRGHMARALMEAVAFGLRFILEAGTRSGLTYADPIHLIGGGARSSVWNQIIADVTGMRTVEVRNPLGSAVGAAILGGLGSGILPAITTVTQHVHLGAPSAPDTRNKAAYDKGYRLFRDLYEDLVPAFNRLHESGLSLGEDATNLQMEPPQ